MEKIFGLPKAIRSDQGTAFTAENMRRWCETKCIQQIFSPIGDHRGTGLVERFIRTLRSRLGACKLETKNQTFRESADKILADIRSCKNATTGKTPYELMFARTKNFVFSNLANVLDARRLLKKGQWRQAREASYSHVTTRDSESDTDLDETTFVRVEPNRKYRAKKATTTPSSETESDVAELISDEESQRSAPSGEHAGSTSGSASVVEVQSEVPSTHSEVKKTPNERIFMKKRTQAKAGANNFVDVTHLIAKETPHTFTLTNGKVVRKNEMRKCLDTPEPPAGTFGTPCKLLRERVFVHPENTKKHEQWLARETKKSRRKREAYRAKRWAEKQRSAEAAQRSAEQTVAPAPRQSQRPRRATDTPGGVPICFITQKVNKLRIRAGLRRRKTQAAPRWTRDPQRGKQESEDAKARRVRREAEIETALQGRTTLNSRSKAWSYPFSQPQTMIRWTTFHRLNDVPKHRRCFYPKPMVPTQFVDEPHYKQLAEQVTEIRGLCAHVALSGKMFICSILLFGSYFLPLICHDVFVYSTVGKLLIYLSIKILLRVWFLK